MYLSFLLDYFETIHFRHIPFHMTRVNSYFTRFRVDFKLGRYEYVKLYFVAIQNVVYYKL